MLTSSRVQRVNLEQLILVLYHSLLFIVEQYHHFIIISAEQHSTFNISTALTVKAVVFRDVTSCSLVDIDRIFAPHKAVIFGANTVFIIGRISTNKFIFKCVRVRVQRLLKSFSSPGCPPVPIKQLSLHEILI